MVDTKNKPHHLKTIVPKLSMIINDRYNSYRDSQKQIRSRLRLKKKAASTQKRKYRKEEGKEEAQKIKQ